MHSYTWQTRIGENIDLTEIKKILVKQGLDLAIKTNITFKEFLNLFGDKFNVVVQGNIKLYINGDVYIGDILNKDRHGNGEWYTYDNNTKFIGKWKNNIADYGTLFMDDTSLTGTFNEKLEINGYGEIKRNNFYYKGEIVNNNPQGLGEVTTDNIKFVGTFINGLLTGKAISYVNNEKQEIIKELNYINGEVVDEIKISFIEQNNYCSLILDNLHEKGNGIMRFANGNIYEGNIENIGKDNQILYVVKGKGKLTFAKGDIYEGIFTAKIINGKFKVDYLKKSINGLGKKIFANGNIYEGEFIKGAFNGKGLFTFKDGRTCHGEFKNNKRHGYCVEKKNDKILYEGICENDKFINK